MAPCTFPWLIARTSVSERGPLLLQYDLILICSYLKDPIAKQGCILSFQADMNIWGTPFNTVQKEGSKSEGKSEGNLRFLREQWL